MEKAQLIRFQRHDLVVVSQIARQRICDEVSVSFSEEARPLVMQALAYESSGVGLPGIVRRSEVLEEGMIPIGFVPLERFKEMRLRVPAFASFEEVIEIIRPCELLKRQIRERNKCMRAAAAVADFVAEGRLDLGILGSAGLEIYTGLPYTNDDSDIDLLIGPHNLDDLATIYNTLKAMGKEHNVAIDLEVSLPNGYGVKAAEIFMRTSYILGKSIKYVDLLSRDEVQTVLNAF